MVASSSVASLLAYTFKKFISHVLSTKHQRDINKRNNSRSERFQMLWKRLAMTLQHKPLREYKGKNVVQRGENKEILLEEVTDFGRIGNGQALVRRG